MPWVIEYIGSPTTAPVLAFLAGIWVGAVYATVICRAKWRWSEPAE